MCSLNRIDPIRHKNDTSYGQNEMARTMKMQERIQKRQLGQTGEESVQDTWLQEILFAQNIYLGSWQMYLLKHYVTMMLRCIIYSDQLTLPVSRQP